MNGLCLRLLDRDLGCVPPVQAAELPAQGTKRLAHRSGNGRVIGQKVCMNLVLEDVLPVPMILEQALYLRRVVLPQLPANCSPVNVVGIEQCMRELMSRRIGIDASTVAGHSHYVEIIGPVREEIEELALFSQ